MTSPEAINEHPLALLDHVETLVGMSFFSDPELVRLAREDPWQIPEEQLALRGLLYGKGIEVLERALQGAQPPESLSPDFFPRIRSLFSDDISDIRSGLMLADSGLITPEVSQVKQALDLLPPQPTVRFEWPEVQVEQLQPWQLTAEGISRLVNITAANVRSVAKSRGIPLEKHNLPGANRRELCFDVTFVRALAAQYGLRPHILDAGGVDWDALQQNANDDRPGREEREERVRELQVRVIPPHKLRNIPEMQAKLPPERPAPLPELYHVPLSNLRRLMGVEGAGTGGYHFVNDLAAKTGVFFRMFSRPHGKGPGLVAHVSLEQAAMIFSEYTRIPEAAEDGDWITITQAVREADGEMEEALLAKLTDEERKYIRPMRSSDPKTKGRVLDHIPRAVVARAQGVMRKVILPPHLVPTQVANKFFDGLSWNGVMRAAVQLRKSVIFRSHQGSSDKPQAHTDWQTIYRMQQHPNRRPAPDSPAIDLDRLPRGPYETDPDRVAYAREIQTWLLGKKAMKSALLHEPTSIVPPDRHTFPVLPLHPFVDVPDYRNLQPAGERPNVGFLRPGKAPAGFVPLRTIDRINMTLDRAAEYVRQNGGLVIDFSDERGEKMRCVDALGTSLLRYRAGKVAINATRPAEGWCNREQIAEATNLSQYVVDHLLRNLDIAEVRAQLDVFFAPKGSRTGLKPLSTQTPVMVWCPVEGDRILPHYNPAVLNWLVARAKGLHNA